MIFDAFFEYADIVDAYSQLADFMRVYTDNIYIYDRFSNIIIFMRSYRISHIRGNSNIKLHVL